MLAQMAFNFDLEIRGTLGGHDDSHLVRADDIVHQIEADRDKIVPKGAPYRVLLRSDGGEIEDCLDIYTALRQIGRPIEVTVEHAWGGSALILAAGDRRRATKESYITLCRPVVSDVIRSRHDALRIGKKVEDARIRMIDVLAAAGFGCRKQVNDWMSAGQSMSATEAWQFGWVDDLIDDVDMRVAA